MPKKKKETANVINQALPVERGACSAHEEVFNMKFEYARSLVYIPPN